MRPADYYLVTYLVAWDDSLMLKAGVTTRKRWRQFCTRGARLVLLHMAASGTPNVCALESALDREMRLCGLQRAFPDKATAAPIIGGQGCGYLECRAASSEEQFIHAQASCAGIMLGHPTGQCGISLPTLMHGRTDVRTHVEPPSVRYESSRSVTRELQADSSR